MVVLENRLASTGVLLEGNKLSTKSIAPKVIDIKGKQPIGYYIDLAKQQPGKKLAFIHKRTRAPRMGITYDGNKVKISSGGPAMESKYIKGGKLNQAYIDKIYSSRISTWWWV